MWSRATSHWVHCDGGADQTRLLFEHLPIHYLILFPGERDCAMVDGLGEELERVASFGDDDGPIEVLRWRR